MKKGSAALRVFLLSVAIAISVCVMPAFAELNCESNAPYDYDGSSDYFGEEIQAKVTINPGENEVKDMRIDILEAEALIDDNSFKHTIDPTPTGEDKRSVTREGHTLFCDELKRGESITLMFNAYPKTLKKKDIKVADVKVSYTQLGQRLDDEEEEVRANLENSVWFRYDDAEKMASSAKWMFYVGIAGIILCVMIGVLWYRERSRSGLATGEKLYDFVKCLKGIKEKVDEKEVVRNMEDEIEKYEREGDYKNYKNRIEGMGGKRK